MTPKDVFNAVAFTVLFYMWIWHFTSEARSVMRALPRKFGWFLQFLTFIVLTLVTLYYGYQTLFAVSSSPLLPPSSLTASAGGALLAVATTVCVMYYGLSAVPGVHVIHPRLRTLYPTWYGIGTHAVPMLILWLDVLWWHGGMSFDDRAFVMFYACITLFGMWELVIRCRTGKFPYAFLNGKHSLLKFSACVMTVYAITLAAFVAGRQLRVNQVAATAAGGPVALPVAAPPPPQQDVADPPIQPKDGGTALAAPPPPPTQQCLPRHHPHHPLRLSVAPDSRGSPALGLDRTRSHGGRRDVSLSMTATTPCWHCGDGGGSSSRRHSAHPVAPPVVALPVVAAT